MSGLEGRLGGRVIALPETRELDLFAAMLEKRGAKTRRCPLIGIHDSPDTAAVSAWLKQCCADEFDDLILLTGEGLRRLLGFAERGGIKGEFVTALGKLRHITRGPKPARELRNLGLKSDLPASTPTTDGVIETLRQHDLGGRRVAVQLYGDNPNTPLIKFLQATGASTHPVAPYVYADAAEASEVVALIQDLAVGSIDAIGFTSSPQVSRLCKVASQEGLKSQLADGMAKTLVAAVGPLVAESLRDAGFAVDLMPRDNYFLKPLVNDLCSQLGPVAD